MELVVTLEERDLTLDELYVQLDGTFDLLRHGHQLGKERLMSGHDRDLRRLHLGLGGLKHDAFGRGLGESRGLFDHLSFFGLSVS